MSNWCDETSYRRDERRGETEPRTWVIRFGWLRVIVTRHIHHPPDAWLLVCDAMNIDYRDLESSDLAEAQRRALEIVGKRLKDAMDELKALATE